MKKVKGKLWVTVYGLKPEANEETEQVTIEMNREAAGRWLGAVIIAMAQDTTVERSGHNPFEGWRPIEMIVTNENGKKTMTDLKWERLSRIVDGTSMDFTRAIVDPETGKITGWKENA
jgi:hypothetical protein